MLRISCLIFVLSVLLRQSEAASSETCQTQIKHDHCVIEYASKDRIAHTEKYTYNTLFRKCTLLRWSNDAELCPVPTGDVNLFGDESTCTNECSGYA